MLIASMKNPHAGPDAGRVYNVCDDEAADPAEVIAYACKLLAWPLPLVVSLEEAGLTDLGLSFYRDNKCVSNARIKTELGVVLAYPDYRAGLKALLTAEAS